MVPSDAGDDDAADPDDGEVGPDDATPSPAAPADESPGGAPPVPVPPSPTPAGTGALAIDCDASIPDVQTNCSYLSGEAFAIQVHVAYAPAEGYFGLQAKLAWHDAQLDLQPEGQGASWAVWSGCGVPAQFQDTVAGAPSLLSGCVPFPLPAEGRTDTGAVFQFGFRCVQDGRAPLRLIPAAGDGQLGSHFVDRDMARIEPALANAQVTCGPCPSDDCPPAPLAGLGRVAVDCDATAGGVQAGCRYAPGESFSVQVHIIEPPARGFYDLRGAMRWDEEVFVYLPPDSQETDGCNFSPGWSWGNYQGDGLVTLGCTAKLREWPPPLTLFAGPFLEMQFRCAAAGVAIAALDGFLNGSAEDTWFSDGEQMFAPYLENAVITCG
jgi:hypothetical protein